jgi:hypothetical protein
MNGVKKKIPENKTLNYGHRLGPVFIKSVEHLKRAEASE